MTTPDRDETLARLLEMGVPYYLALEAVASTALDRDDDVGTQSLSDWAESEDRAVRPDAEVRRGKAARTEPAWLHETDDGLEIRDRD